MTTENQTAELNPFPKPLEDGFYYASAEDESLDVATKTYDNGSIVKKIVLKDKRVAIVREVTGKEVNIARTMAGNNAQNFTMALAAVAVKIDDQKITPEELEGLKAKDYLAITAANAELNFL